MATPPNPLAAGGSPAEGMLGPILGALNNRASNPGQDLAQQSAQLQGADPSITLRQLDNIKNMLVVLFVRNVQVLPDLANEISNVIKALTKAMEKGQKASQTTETVKAATEQNRGPISFGPVMPGIPGTDQSQTPEM